MATHVAVGQRTKRLDGPAKLTGQERYTADLQIPGLLHGRLVGSAYAHARIAGVDKEAALALRGVVAVLTSADLPVQSDKQGRPMKTVMAQDVARYVGHAVALVLAESDAAAQDGAAAVEIDYEPLPVITTVEQALAPDAPRIVPEDEDGDDEEASMHNVDAAQASDQEEDLPPNVTDTINFSRGDVAQGFADADEIVELSLTSDGVHQGYIEPQVALAVVEPLGDLMIYSSTQAAFSGRKQVAELLGLPARQVNVMPMPIGGGFGGKFVYIEPLVAAAAMAVGRPVLLQYTRMDDLLGGNPAPGCTMTVKLGGTRDGKLTALQADLTFVAGAGAGSPLQICAILLGGNYRVPHLEIRGREVMTNRPVPGAYRAPGAQQAAFAIESAMDELAHQLDLDPLELRLTNCVAEGDPRPNGNTWPRIGMRECLEALQAHPLWQERETSRAAGNGLGIAVAGWPGGIEPATAVCRLDADGRLTVVLGTTDLTGTNTSFAQIAAETFGMAPADIHVTTAPTSAAPFAPGAGGSKITYSVGIAVQRAAEDARQQILAIAAQRLEAAVDDLEITDGMVRVKGVPSSGISLQEMASISTTVAGAYEPVYGKGSSAITESAAGFAAHLAEVSVDELTGETRVHRYVAVQDVGFAINPAAVEGQIHGGVVQGIGWALHERLVHDDDGQLLTASLMDYALPTADLAPPIDVVLVEIPSAHGAYGAKGVGEPPAIPGAAAIANAIRDAVGVRVTSIPMTPETVARSLWERPD